MSKTKVIIGSFVGVLFYALFIFLGAWTFDYWQGKLYVVVALVGTALNHLLQRPGSNLTVERAKGAPSGEAWDRKLLGAYFLVVVVTFVVAGMDSGHFGWSGAVPLGVTVAGVALTLVGQMIFALAKRQNDFFSSTVRIQTETAHEVCTTGLYGVVRHPGYVGMLVSMLAFPLLMNAYWAFVPALIASSLLVVRTVLEDRFLTDSLPGYKDYAQRTRWRLIPGIF